MHKIFFVLPLKINSYESGSDLERVKKILFPSMVKYFDLNQIRQFLIIVPDNEQQEILMGLREFEKKLNLSVISEKKVLALIPGWKKHAVLHRALDPLKRIDRRINGGKLFEHLRLKKGWNTSGGWVKQQMLKIFAAKLIDGDYYMTLDADLCLTRPADFKILFPDGKAISTLAAAGKHSEWWACSARILGTKLQLKDEDLVTGVTPVILSTSVVIELINYLHLKSQENRYMTIFEYLATVQGWTEYSLYWLFLLQFYGKEKYYTDENHVQIRHQAYSVWERHQAPDVKALRERIDSAFHDKRSLFLVIQSSCIPLVECHEVIKDYLL